MGFFWNDWDTQYVISQWLQSAGGTEMPMETRILGRTGLEVGVIGLGTEHLTFNRANMDAVLDIAVVAGVNYIDLIYNDPLMPTPTIGRPLVRLFASIANYWFSPSTGVSSTTNRLITVSYALI